MTSFFENLVKQLQQEPKIGVFSIFGRKGMRIGSTPETRTEKEAQQTQFNKEQGIRLQSWLNQTKILPRVRLP